MPASGRTNDVNRSGLNGCKIGTQSGDTMALLPQSCAAAVAVFRRKPVPTKIMTRGGPRGGLHQRHLKENGVLCRSVRRLRGASMTRVASIQADKSQASGNGQGAEAAYHRPARQSLQSAVGVLPASGKSRHAGARMIAQIAPASGLTRAAATLHSLCDRPPT